jgi:hypothetical protein
MNNEDRPPAENPNERVERTGGDEGLRKWLKGYVESHPQQPTAVLSRAQYIGVSRRALDSYIAGTYFLPEDEGGEGVDPKASKIEHGIHRHVDMIIPRLLDLREKNQAKLEAGAVTMEQIIRVAGSRMVACL